jgi:hypothetical protein
MRSSIIAAAILPAAVFVAFAPITATAGDAKAKDQASAVQLPPPPTGKGQVVFFRRSAFKAIAMTYSVREGDKVVGTLGNGSYFVLTADPGPHEYRVISDIRDVLHMEVEAGETHYVQEIADIGVFVGKVTLAPSDADTFKGMKLKARPAAE